jgi:hypothetical protein
MNDPRVLFDHLLIGASVLASVGDWLWSYPRRVREIAAGVPGARARLYRDILVLEWGFAICVIGLWLARDRDFDALGMGASTPLRLGIGFALAAAYVALMAIQSRSIRARPQLLDRVRRKMADYDTLLPHTPGERRGFIAVSIAAGVCEEIFYRGFAMAYVGAWAGPLTALAASSLLFGFAHVYLGVSHVWRTTLLGLLFGLVALVSGAIWPAIIIHVVMDLVAGDLGYGGAGAAPAADPGPGIRAGA